MNPTLIVITKDRPQMAGRLIHSFLQAKLDSYSIVIVDDSNPADFLQTKNFLESHSVRSVQLSSVQARTYVAKDLDKAPLPPYEKRFIEDCTGIHSPFTEFVECLYRSANARLKSVRAGQWFAPYASARNLGIYCAVKFFDPDVILFMDDDCLVLKPEEIETQFQLIGATLRHGEVVAIGGNYRNLPLSKHNKASGRGVLGRSMGILRGMDAFLKRSLAVENTRFQTMPPHMLGGALILSKRVFHKLPFDPYVARGEDHAYAWDLRAFLSEKQISIRDNHFLVGHRRKEPSPEHEETNILRDIFRFVYMHAKVGRSFIPFFTARWAIASLFSCFFNPWKYTSCKRELWALMVLAPLFAKENANEFRRNSKLWVRFLNHPK